MSDDSWMLGLADVDGPTPTNSIERRLERLRNKLPPVEPVPARLRLDVQLRKRRERMERHERHAYQHFNAGPLAQITMIVSNWYDDENGIPTRVVRAG